MKKIIVCILLLFIYACKQSYPKTTINHDKSADKSSNNHEEEEPKSIAPPPAYGNKVVKK